LAIVIRFNQNRLSRVFPQIWVKPRKSNVSGFPDASLRAMLGGEAPELHQAGLVGVQL
jgi:hypothetical protein